MTTTPLPSKATTTMTMASLKRHRSRRTMTGARPRQVSPLPPLAHKKNNDADKENDGNHHLLLPSSFDKEHKLPNENKYRTTTLYSSSSSPSCPDDDNDDDSMTTLASPPRRRRRFLQHSSQWNFSVGPFAHDYSFGSSTLQPQSRRWSINDFDVIEEIGGGCFSCVKLAIFNNTSKVALKQVSMEIIHKKGDVECLRQEVEIQTRLNHQHVLQSFGYFLSRDCITMVLEYARLGSLYECMHDEPDGKFSVTQARHFVQQITSAVAYLESEHVAHRDIKGENVVLTSSNTCKLCDFGYSVRYSHHQDVRTSFCGTPEFVPPEMICENNQRDYVVSLVDPWSLGVLAYELVVGKTPFLLSVAERKRILRQANGKTTRQGILDKVSAFTSLDESLLTCNSDNDTQEWFDFCESLLQVKPYRRMTATQALDHDWLAATIQEGGNGASSRRIEIYDGRHVAKRAKVTAVAV